MFDVSVIVPTHNRAALLEQCLVSLCEQTLPLSRYEICVVNNGSTDNTPEIVDKIAARYPQNRVFRIDEPKPGVARARNSGLRATQSALVAFTDDDCQPYPDWLERMTARFLELGDDTAIVAGEIEPIWESPRPEWISDEMLSPLSAQTMAGKAARYLVESDWIMECNSCFRRSVLEQAGNFPENLGRVGSGLLSGEGCLEYRVRHNGGKGFFDPHIIVRHKIPLARLNPMWFRQRYFWQGISSVAIMQYKKSYGIAPNAQTTINLPSEPQHWDFLTHETTDNIEDSMIRFHDLGFVLALGGIIPIES